MNQLVEVCRAGSPPLSFFITHSKMQNSIFSTLVATGGHLKLCMNATNQGSCSSSRALLCEENTPPKTVEMYCDTMLSSKGRHAVAAGPLNDSNTVTWFGECVQMVGMRCNM